MEEWGGGDTPHKGFKSAAFVKAAESSGRDSQGMLTKVKSLILPKIEITRALPLQNRKDKSHEQN